MSRSHSSRRRFLAVVVALAFLARIADPAFGQSPVKMKKFTGSIDVTAEGAVPFTLEGTASHLGRFTAHGEVVFVPGEEEGTLVGEGVAVFIAANGDQLVAAVRWEVDPESDGLAASGIHFSWRDDVTFSDGTVVASTGRFEHDRPPGLVVIAIIAILIGLLLPAVQ